MSKRKAAVALAPDARAEQVRAVIALIEQGSSENAACAQVGINRATFRAAALREGVSESYARALESLAADQIEKLEQAIDDMRSGKIDAQMARVEIDARKWFASKFLPKRYGDKVHLEANVTTRNADELPDDELARIARSGRE